MTAASPSSTSKVSCPDCQTVHAAVFADGASSVKLTCSCGRRLRVLRKETATPPLPPPSGGPSAAPPPVDLPLEFEDDDDVMSAPTPIPERALSAEADMSDVRRAWADAVGTASDEGLSLKSMDSGGVGSSAAASIVASLRAARGVSSGERKTATLTPPTRTVATTGAPAQSGDFVVGSLIGRGGMGLVFRAEQSVLGRTVALKTMMADRTEDASSRLKFLYEARVTGQLDHPNIVPVYDLASAPDGTLFYTMKEVRGHAWSKTIHALGESENIDILLKVADAVAFAHDKGVVHRDIKPENVMLGDYGEVLLLDWGLAVGIRDGGRAERLTAKNARGGTPAYMAPEMAAGDSTLIAEGTDVYLLGAVLYEILTGVRPHHGESVFGCIYSALVNRIEASERRDEWVRVAHKAMASRPGDRFKTVKAFQQAIRECRDHAASRTVATEAKKALARARRGESEDDYGSYGDYAKAVFGFEEALRLWEDNAAAEKGLTVARRAYGEAALAREDYALALAQSTALPAGLSGDLPERVARAQRDHIRRRRRTTLLGRAAMVAMGAIAIYGVYATGAIRLEQMTSAREREKITEAAEAKVHEANERVRLALSQRDEKEKKIQEKDKEIRILTARIPMASPPASTGGGTQAVESTPAGDGDLLATSAGGGEAKAPPAGPSVADVSPATADASTPAKDEEGRTENRPLITTPQELRDAFTQLNRGFDVSRLRFDEGLTEIQVSNPNRIPPGMTAEAAFGDMRPLARTPVRTLRLIGYLPSDVFKFLEEEKPAHLRELVLSAPRSTKLSLHPLKGLPLTDLTVFMDQFDGLAEILPGMPLAFLNLSKAPAEAMKALTGNTTLKTLYLVFDAPPMEGHDAGALDPDFLKALEATPLELIHLTHAPTTSLLPLAGKKDTLKELHLHGTPITTLEPLRGFSLKQLTLAQTRVPSLEPLEGMALEKLAISQTPVDVAKVLDFIRRTPTLRRVALTRMELRDVDGLRDIPMSELDIRDNPLSTLAPLAEKPVERLLFTAHPDLEGVDLIRKNPHIQTLIIEDARGTLHSSMERGFWNRYDKGEFFKK